MVKEETKYRKDGRKKASMSFKEKRARKTEKRKQKLEHRIEHTLE